MMRFPVRLLVLAGALALATGVSHGYYHFVQYLTRSGPYQPVYTKFDLTALTAKTVQYFVSDQGPTQLAANDTFANVIAQIRLAAKTWSDVEISDLRLAFGGLTSPGTSHVAPVIEVLFDEVPPGLIALGGPTSKGDPQDRGAGVFVPILKSTVILRRDLSQRPSWSESFFLSVTHEFGHALGLQHSWTSGVMSTELTRATTKARPLAADDLAGIGLLYPSRSMAMYTGSISGRVTLGANGANLASVVAVSLDGSVVSALTHPDGTYRIEGIPPGSYNLYVHPLPPPIGSEGAPGGVFLPVDLDGRTLAASPAFESQFYPGVKDPVRAAPFPVAAGASLENVNFTVTRRANPSVYAVQTYSFPGQVAVKPAHLTPEGLRPFLVATGYGLTTSTGVQVMGGSAVVPNGGIRAYGGDARFVQMDLQFNLTSGEGGRHLLFSSDNDVYLLPSAFRLTRALPPQIGSVSASLDGNGNRVVTVVGTGLSADTRILFGGQPALVQNYDPATGSFRLIPPPAVAGERAAVVALNKDGQSSLFLQGNAPPMYEFEGGEAGSISVSPSQMAAGTEGLVEILGTGTYFMAPYVGAQMGTSAITVRRVIEASPTRLLLHVAVAPNAPGEAAQVSVTNGLRLLTNPGAFQVTAPNARLSYFRGLASDPGTGRNAMPAGGLAQVRLGGPLAEGSANGWQLTIGDRPAPIVSLSEGTLTFRVPAAVPPGPAIMRLTAGNDTVIPSFVVIDPPPPVLSGVTVSGAKVDATRPVRSGELVTISVNGLADNGASVPEGRVTVNVGAVSHPAVQVDALSAGGHLVQFLLDAAVPTGSHTLTVQIDGRPSTPGSLPVRAN